MSDRETLMNKAERLLKDKSRLIERLLEDNKWAGAEILKAEARIEAALALHESQEEPSDLDTCILCACDWPCPTVNALKGSE